MCGVNKIARIDTVRRGADSSVNISAQSQANFGGRLLHATSGLNNLPQCCNAAVLSDEGCADDGYETHSMTYIMSVYSARPFLMRG